MLNEDELSIIDFQNLAILRRRLSEGLKWFNHSPGNAERTGVLVQMDVIDDLLQAILKDDSADLLLPFRRLMRGLVDAENGKPHFLLQPRKVKSRPPDNAEVMGLRAIAAVAMTLLMKAGLSKLQAARQVANALHKAGHKKPNGQPINAETIIGWRDRVMGGQKSQDLDTARYHRMFSDLNNSFPGAPKQAADHLLRQIGQTVPPLIPMAPDRFR